MEVQRLSFCDTPKIDHATAANFATIAAILSVDRFSNKTLKMLD